MNKQAGFTLAEMMVVVGISTALMVGTTTAILQSNHTAMVAASKGNGQALVREIQQGLTDLQGCKAALNGSNFAPDASGYLSLAINLSGKNLAKGADLAGDGLIVKDIYLSAIRSLDMVGTHNKPMYVGDLMVNMQRKDSSAAPLKTQRISRLYLEVDTGNILTCTTQSRMPDLLSATCIQMGGNYSDGVCDMSAYANAIVLEARRQIDLDLYGPFDKQVNDQVASDLDTAMNDVAQRGDAATTLYTNQAIAAVNARLTQNLNQVNASTDALNTRIVASTTDLTNQNNSAQAYATSVLQQATAAYNSAIGAYGAAQSANALANTTQNNVTYASGIAGNALNYGLSSQQNSAAISGVAYNAMNAAMGAVASSNNSVAAASGAQGAASNAINYANNANQNAAANLNYAVSANDQANNSMGYANSAVGASQNAANYANSAAGQASYAAGVASAAYNAANYAYNNPPQINNINTTIVTFIPYSPPPPPPPPPSGPTDPEIAAPTNLRWQFGSYLNNTGSGMFLGMCGNYGAYIGAPCSYANSTCQASSGNILAGGGMNSFYICR